MSLAPMPVKVADRGRRSVLAFAAPIALGIVLSVGGACGDDPTPIRQNELPPPALALVSPAAGGCVEFVPGADPRVPIQLKIDGVYLREALRGRPTLPAAAIAIVEAYLDCELSR